MRRAVGAVALTLLAAVGLVAVVPLSPPRSTHAPTRAAPESSGACAAPAAPAEPEPIRAAPRALRLPSGAPPALTCDEARLVVAQARAHLASAPLAVDARELADATADWLDPHGLWSAAPDAPIAALLRQRAGGLLAELEAPPGDGACPTALAAGARLRSWVDELTAVYDAAASGARAAPARDAFARLGQASFEEHAVERPARALARELGRSRASRALYGDALAPFAATARARYVPSMDAEAWADTVLAAAVRAYLPLVDPHGGWAPLDEETALYEIDLEASPPPRVWSRARRAAIGAVVTQDPLGPLEAGDVVLDVGGVRTAGLSVEQLEQLSMMDDASGPPSRTVVVLREGESAPRELEVATSEPRSAAEPAETLAWTRVGFGDDEVLVVRIEDVPDDLGELLAATLAEGAARSRPAGIVLDLRGNGGGLTDGANAALGLFLPGAPLFPLRRRDGSIEVERAGEPPPAARWSGPLAVLVDGESASAAEMIAGALATYRRAVLAGSRTYGKGCAQEYLDDDARRGVLRLSTLVYALPDGSPVQRVGILPQLSLGFAEPREREARLSHTLPTWRGPDVRDASRVVEVPWPSHHGRVGPCDDEGVCKLLRALGAPRTPVARGRR